MDERGYIALNKSRGMSTETLNNWIGWLQARIPALKESHNVYWLKQAMEGYKKDGKQIQIEPDFQKVLHETVFENMRGKPLKNRVSELGKDKMTDNLENMIGNLSSKSKLLDSEQYFRKQFGIDPQANLEDCSPDAQDVVCTMESYANLCVDQELEENRRLNGCVMQNNITNLKLQRTIDELNAEIEALKSNLYGKSFK